MLAINTLYAFEFVQTGTQRTDYRIIYALHYIGLGWAAVHWILDGVNLIGWGIQVTNLFI